MLIGSCSCGACHTVEEISTRLEQLGKPRQSCPCLHTTPCHEDCTCIKPFMSRGCRRCCSYGSEEQQQKKAERLAHAIDCGERWDWLSPDDIYSERDELIKGLRSIAGLVEHDSEPYEIAVRLLGPLVHLDPRKWICSICLKELKETEQGPERCPEHAFETPKRIGLQEENERLRNRLEELGGNPRETKPPFDVIINRRLTTIHTETVPNLVIAGLAGYRNGADIQWEWTAPDGVKHCGTLDVDGPRLRVYPGMIFYVTPKGLPHEQL